MDRKTEPERASKPRAEQIPTDRDEIARREARNALQQFDAVVKTIDDALQANKVFRLRLSLALEFNRLATSGTNDYPGVFRPGRIEISKSKHVPPSPEEVPVLMEDMCDYVNDNWDRTPIFLSAYVM